MFCDGGQHATSNSDVSDIDVPYFYHIFTIMFLTINIILITLILIILFIIIYRYAATTIL